MSKILIDAYGRTSDDPNWGTKCDYPYEVKSAESTTTKTTWIRWSSAENGVIWRVQTSKSGNSTIVTAQWGAWSNRGFLTYEPLDNFPKTIEI